MSEREMKAALYSRKCKRHGAHHRQYCAKLTHTVISFISGGLAIICIVTFFW